MVKNGYTIFECKQCGHRFLEIDDYENHVDNVYAENYFSEGGHGYPN